VSHRWFERLVRCTPAFLASAFLVVPHTVGAQGNAANVPATPAVAAQAAQPAAVPRTWRNDWFRDSDYFNPLIAEPRAPQIAFTFPAWIPELQYSVEPGTRLAWEVSLGREMPIFSRANFDEATRRKGSQGFGLWVDVSFHMLEDMGKDPSNPIINTDYRFSLGKLKYYRIMSTPTLSTGNGRSTSSVAVAQAA